MDKQWWLLLVLAITIGCGSGQTAQQPTTTDTDSQQQANEDSAEEEKTTTDGALSDKQVATVLAQYLGKWEGTSLIKGPDGDVQAEFPCTYANEWLHHGKSIEMQHTEKPPQGDQKLIFTKWYDSKQKRFLVTRRLPGEEEPAKPGAYETYDAVTNTFDGVVLHGLPPGASFTWTSKWINQDKYIYTHEFRQDGKVQQTSINTYERAQPAPAKPAVAK